MKCRFNSREFKIERLYIYYGLTHFSARHRFHVVIFAIQIPINTVF
jgi:hypothetical protein